MTVPLPTFEFQIEWEPSSAHDLRQLMGGLSGEDRAKVWARINTLKDSHTALTQQEKQPGSGIRGLRVTLPGHRGLRVYYRIEVCLPITLLIWFLSVMEVRYGQTRTNPP